MSSNPMSANPDRLYTLLPAVYRLRDAAQGEPLRALLALIQQEYDAVETDIANLYENWFIETCAEWVVPYIGDLLDVRPVYAASAQTFSARSYVANTLSFRRRKGTAAMLEQLAFDVTGWPARVDEFFQLLATTQYLNHLRLNSLATVSLRDADALELLGGPFEQSTHTADVRHIWNGRGKYNIPNLGIFLWRLQAYQVGPLPISSQAPTKTDASGVARQSTAHALATPSDGRYTFSPLGASAPLFNLPQTPATDNQRVTELNVPVPLRRRPLYLELEALRQGEVDNAPRPTPVYFASDPVFQLAIDGTLVPFEQVMICDTNDVSSTDWRRPANSKTYQPTAGGPAKTLPITLAVDPVRGRITFPAGATLPAHSLQVSYVYGFSGDLGAGPYDRGTFFATDALAPAPFNSSNRWQVAVSQELAAVPKLVFNSFATAIDAWNQQVTGAHPVLDGVIAVLDSATYAEDLSTTPLKLPAGSRLLIVAADWAAVRQNPRGKALTLDPDGLRPHLLGNLAVLGTAPSASPDPGQLFIDGLLINGHVNVEPGNLGLVQLSHTTITPGGISVQTASAETNGSLQVSLYRAICGPIAIDAASPAQLTATDSIISSASGGNTDSAITAPGTTASISTSTVLGAAGCLIFSASDSIFTGKVTATRKQAGCVRFSFIPNGSHTAQRYRCQPDLALANVPTASQPPILVRVYPQFTSTDIGQPGFAQLSQSCPVEIGTGADNESEMGAFNFLQQPQRATNLQTALNEYLRFGLEAGALLQT